MWHVPDLVVSLFSVDLAPSSGACVAKTFGSWGVLQRLALCYGIGATLALYLSRGR